MTKLFEKILRPMLFRLPAETAHELGMAALRSGMVGGDGPADFGMGAIERFGLKFANPIGMAAGFDKNGLVVDQLASLGFGFVEVGTVTFRPQPGNEKPRLFRLPEDEALLNRLGFNNDGARSVAERLGGISRRCVVGVNIGRNKDVPNEDAIANYLASFDLLKPVADYVTINVSSPNTPNLRELQSSENLEGLLTAIRNRNDETEPLPLLVKIAPDLTEADVEAIVDSCMRLKIDGIIATNTTVSRDGLRTEAVGSLGAGGISGRPLTGRSTEVIRTIYRHSRGKIPIIGVGGIFDAEDAFEKIAAGACLLQVYTGFVYKGPSLVRTLNRDLRRILVGKGIKSLNDAVGIGT